MLHIGRHHVAGNSDNEHVTPRFSNFRRRRRAAKKRFKGMVVRKSRVVEKHRKHMTRRTYSMVGIAESISTES